MPVIIHYRPAIPLQALESNFDEEVVESHPDARVRRQLRAISMGVASNLPADQKEFDNIEAALSWVEGTPEVDAYQLIEDGRILINEIEEIDASEWRQRLATPPPPGFEGKHSPFRQGGKIVPRAPGAPAPPQTPRYGQKYGPRAQRG